MGGYWKRTWGRGRFLEESWVSGWDNAGAIHWNGKYRENRFVGERKSFHIFWLRYCDIHVEMSPGCLPHESWLLWEETSFFDVYTIKYLICSVSILPFCVHLTDQRLQVLISFFNTNLGVLGRWWIQATVGWVHWHSRPGGRVIRMSLS